MDVFAYEDYGDAVRASVELNKERRGYLTQLAQAAGCQKSYLSQVIRGHAHFTPEHAIGIAQLWGLSDHASEYFLQLVHLGRTSFPPLQKKIRARLNELKRERADLSARLREDSLQELQAQMFYYSSWAPSAIDVMVGIKGLRSIPAIAARLGLSAEYVGQCLSQLEKYGTVKRIGNEWTIAGGNIHLKHTSPLNSTNHRNWRERAVIDSQNSETDGVHYTSVQTLSAQDFERVRSMMLEFIDRQRSVVEPSKEEVLASFTCDWFRV